MNRLKLGTVPFLNSKPLVYPLEKGLIENSIDIEYYVPSLLSEKLKSREIDIGLIPVAELLKNPDYRVLPGISISSFGSVDSVLLISKKDIQEIKHVALDKRSRSSSALLKIVLEKFYRLNPLYTDKEIDDSFLDCVDAGMLIGDAGLKAKHNMPRGYRTYDLGELWTNMTNLPFVYAVFAYHHDTDLLEHLNILLKSKELGKSLIDEIVSNEHAKLGLSEKICKHYLKICIKYDLGEEEIEAINIFGEYLIEFDTDLSTISKELRTRQLSTTI